MLILFFLLSLSHSVHGGDTDSTGGTNDSLPNAFEPGSSSAAPRATLFEPDPEEQRIHLAEEALQQDTEELKRKTQKRMERCKSADAPHPGDEWGFCVVQ